MISLDQAHKLAARMGLPIPRYVDGGSAGEALYELFHHLLNRVEDLETRLDVHNHDAH